MCAGEKNLYNMGNDAVSRKEHHYGTYHMVTHSIEFAIEWFPSSAWCALTTLQFR